MAETTPDGDKPAQITAPSDSRSETASSSSVQTPTAAALPNNQPTKAPLDAGNAFNAELEESSGPAPTVDLPDNQQTSDIFSGGEEVTEEEPITWTASEFIAHSKTASWYGLLALITIVLAALVYLVTRRDVISTGMVVVGAILFGIVAARKPKEQQYQLDNQGMQIGPRRYSYNAFRSFSVVPEGAFSSIIFMPLKRFSPLATIYFAPEDERRIVDLLTDYLPYEEYKHDLFDQLLHRIRF